jgi:hypothetical protein
VADPSAAGGRFSTDVWPAEREPSLCRVSTGRDRFLPFANVNDEKPLTGIDDGEWTVIWLRKESVHFRLS